MDKLLGKVIETNLVVGLCEFAEYPLDVNSVQDYYYCYYYYFFRFLSVADLLAIKSKFTWLL